MFCFVLFLTTWLHSTSFLLNTINNCCCNILAYEHRYTVDFSSSFLSLSTQRHTSQITVNTTASFQFKLEKKSLFVLRGQFKAHWAGDSQQNLLALISASPPMSVGRHRRRAAAAALQQVLTWCCFAGKWCQFWEETLHHLRLSLLPNPVRLTVLYLPAARMQPQLNMWQTWHGINKD